LATARDSGFSGQADIDPESTLPPGRVGLRVRARLLLAFLVVGLAPPLFLYFAIHHANVQHFERVSRSTVTQISDVQQRRINVELERMREHLALVASRTQMRISLREYNRDGEAVHVALIDRILRDALAAQRNIAGIWLRDAADGLVTAVTGEPGPPADEVMPADMPGNATIKLTLIEGGRPRLWLQGPLWLDGNRVGSIQLLMRLDDLQAVLLDFPHEHRGGKTYLLVPDAEGRLQALDEDFRQVEGPGMAPGSRWQENLQAARDTVLDKVANEGAWVQVRPLQDAFGAVMVSLSRAAFESELRQQRRLLLYLIGFASLLSILMALFMARMMARPLEVLSRATRALRQGGKDVAIREDFWGEFADLVRSFNFAVDVITRRTRALNQEVEARRASQRQLADMANSDPLTGLANRRHFMQVLERQVGDADHGRADSLLFLDLDNFKPVNDRLGHAAGDKLLQVIAERLRHLVRDSDLVARIGGDEFAMLLIDDGAEAVDPDVIAQRIETQISMPINVDDELVQVGCSIGIAALSGAASASDVLSRADAAMYEVKAIRPGRTRRST
jgi:diguanylate cyclase (GGDEF)-like protein